MRKKENQANPNLGEFEKEYKRVLDPSQEIHIII